MMIKAIIFDCFGVLVGDVFRTKAAVLEKTDPAGADEIYAALKRMDKGLISREDGVREIAKALTMSPEEANALSISGEVRNAPLIEVIPGLRQRYKVGLLTNVRGRSWLEDRFLPGELDELFDAVVASGDVGIAKPEPGIYQLILSQLDVQPGECVMIDDSLSSCDGARAVGIQPIHFVSNTQALDELHAVLDGTAHI